MNVYFNNTLYILAYAYTYKHALRVPVTGMNI